MGDYDALVERAARAEHAVAIIGGLDAGKTTFAKAVIRAALAAGRTPALLDCDLGQKSVGPPCTVGLKLAGSEADLEADALSGADGVWFVGSTSPQGHSIPLITGVAALSAKARELGADLLVVDTSGLVSGVYGQLLKYHKFEVLRPNLVVGLRRGEELNPILGHAQRFFSAEVVALDIPPEVVSTSVEQRAELRREAMARYFSGEVQRWRVKSTVFMPVLPPLFELSLLDRLLVGLSDGRGGYPGVGYLEHAADEGVLRLMSPVAEAPKALRLGSVRLEEDYRAKRVDLRNLFGAE
ncbi:MAG TPA: polynucleotide 5'-hydroxyl-kinase [Actinomycetota bacterium]|nr:polynucleotide 5'-hydroxyl-kinase [Actinomycetota bacterium]